MADVKISRELFIALCKYHLYEPESVDQESIRLQLSEKLDRVAAHDKYTAALFTGQTPASRRGQGKQGAGQNFAS